MSEIPVREINNVRAAKVVFGGGRVGPELTYLGTPIEADFELSYESLAQYVGKVLDLVASIEGSGNFVHSVKILNGVVEVS